MKKTIKSIILIFIFFFLFQSNVNAQEKVKLYLFHNYDCPHCKQEQDFLNRLVEQNENVEIIKYEIKKDKDNRELLEKFAQEANIEVKGVPFTVIGTNYFEGYNEDIGTKIRCTINYYNENEHRDIVSEYLETGKVEEYKQQFDLNTCEFKVPILGTINPKKVSLPLIATVIGLVDGFNPCAMWVLIFLISLMLGMKNRKRMWCLGLAFLFTSAFVYFGFMMAWVNIAEFLKSSKILEILIAIIALLGGSINLYNFIKEMKKKDVGCSVTDQKSRKKIMQKAKEIVTENSFLLALLGVIILALSVNIIELACSAGLPILFGQILALNDLTKGQILLYNIIYIFFFLIDDLIVFIIAMVTTKIAGISNKYTKYAHLIGGIIMLLIGILMIFFPNILKFNI